MGRNLNRIWADLPFFIAVMSHLFLSIYVLFLSCEMRSKNCSQPCETWVQTSNRCSRMKSPVDRYGIAKEALRNACRAFERTVRLPCADGARASNENDS